MDESRRKRRADLCYKKASFEVLETFVCFLLLRSRAVIKAKDWFFSTQRPSSSSLSLLSFPSCSSLIRYSSPRECICVSAEKPYILCSRFDVLMTTWRANYAQRFPLQSPFVTFRIPAVTSGLSKLTSLTTSRRDATEKRSHPGRRKKLKKSSRHGKTCSTYRKVYHTFSYVSQSQCFIWIW